MEKIICIKSDLNKFTYGNSYYYLFNISEYITIFNDNKEFGVYKYDFAKNFVEEQKYKEMVIKRRFLK